MIFYKTKAEIELIKESGYILGKAHAEIAKWIKPGVTTNHLDKIAFEFISDNGGVPSFKGYNGFPYTLCVSVNENIVHGMPSNYTLKDDDIISVDCGVKFKGFHSDSAYTYSLPSVSIEAKDLLRITKESLYKGIDAMTIGGRLGDISYAIQNHVESAGYSVVRELVGHGIGKELHESPEVPNYGKRGKGILLQEGLVIAIEPMVNLGKKNTVMESDGWTVRTADKKPSAHFEHTVGIIDNKVEVLTTFEFIEEVLNG